MKNTKRLLSVLCAMALIFTAVVPVMTMGVSAADNLLFQADWETVETTPTMISCPSGAAHPSEMLMSEGGNSYISLDDAKGWSYGAYVFNTPMTKGKSYEVKFDFSNLKGGAGNGALYLTDSAHAETVSIRSSRCFRQAMTKHSFM